MRVSPASGAQARPRAIAHGSDATGSKSVKPPCGGGADSTFQPPGGADARSAGGIGAFGSARGATGSGVVCAFAVLAIHSPSTAGTSELTMTMAASTSTSAQTMRLALRTRSGVSRTIEPAVTAGKAAAASCASPQNRHVTTVEPAGGSPSVAPQPWQRLAVGTRQICHVAFFAGKSTSVDTASWRTLQLHP